MLRVIKGHKDLKDLRVHKEEIQGLKGEQEIQVLREHKVLREVLLVLKGILVLKGHKVLKGLKVKILGLREPRELKVT